MLQTEASAIRGDPTPTQDGVGVYGKETETKIIKRDCKMKTASEKVQV